MPPSFLKNSVPSVSPAKRVVKNTLRLRAFARDILFQKNFSKIPEPERIN
jgi:hypothetical protein